jgi:hypothetical protein
LSKAAKAKNPFYLMLAIVGTLFALTAFAYGIMYLQLVRGDQASAAWAEHPLMRGLRSYGDLALGIELAALGLLTFAAIGTDSFWERRAAQERAEQTPLP